MILLVLLVLLGYRADRPSYGAGNGVSPVLKGVNLCGGSR
jgi:hypothetical protein